MSANSAESAPVSQTGRSSELTLSPGQQITRANNSDDPISQNAVWCAGVLDSGSLGTHESSMTKVSVSEALMRVADRCAQVMGGTGVTQDTIVEQVFREVRAFRIYDGPTEVHKW